MSGRDDVVASSGEPDDLAADVRAELEHHLACAEDELVRAGRTPEEARREARARFGDVEAIETTCRRIGMGHTKLWSRLHWALTIALLIALPILALGNVAASREARARADALRAETEALLDRLREGRAAEARAPVAEIVIGVGDVLRVFDTFNPEVRFQDRVAADGKFLLGDAGWVQAAGLTREEAEAAFTETLRHSFLKAHVRVTVDPWPGAGPLEDE